MDLDSTWEGPEGAKQVTVHVLLREDKVRLWTAETPELYVLVLSLHNSVEDAQVDRRPTQVGATSGARVNKLGSVNLAYVARHPRPMSCPSLCRVDLLSLTFHALSTSLTFHALSTL